MLVPMGEVTTGDRSRLKRAPLVWCLRVYIGRLEYRQDSGGVNIVWLLSREIVKVGARNRNV